MTSGISTSQRAIELARPIVLLAAFIVTERFAGLWAAPLAVIAVFAVALLVHDLIHNALHLPSRTSRAALCFFALWLIKSGHALKESHMRHHQRCLEEDDEEGRVVHDSIPRLIVLGPWLALRARWTSFRDGKKSRGWQLAETALNVVIVIGLVILALRGTSWAPALYLGAVVVVTVSAPIWGAKIPHSIPTDHPLVAWVRARIGRWTPAASSVVFHELHHRSPRVAVALLAERRAEIELRPPSPCDSARRDGSE